MKSRINEILGSFREFVTAHDYQNTPILTAYVDVDPTNPDNQRKRPAWLIELKNETKKLEQSLDPEEVKRRDTQRKWARAEEMVMNHLRDRKPTGRSIVLFTDLEDFIAVDLPVSVETRLYYGLPQIKHLLFALDQYKKYLAILFSGADVRLLEVFLTRTTDELRVETDHELARRFGRKSKTLAADRRDAEFERRFVREATNEINQSLLADPDFERLVFGGNLKQAHAVKAALHPAAKDLVVAVESMDFKLPEGEIARMVKRIADRYEEEHDIAVVEDLVTRYNRKGPAVLEQQSVESALSHGRVKTLVIPYPIDREDFDPLIVEATVHGAGIEFVYGKGADKLNEFGGIGAALYYAGS